MEKKEKSILWSILFAIVILVFNPGTYITLLFLFAVWHIFGMIGKIIVVIIIAYIITTIHMFFTEGPEGIKRMLY